jgi:hypothetical protein
MNPDIRSQIDERAVRNFSKDGYFPDVEEQPVCSLQLARMMPSAALRRATIVSSGSSLRLCEVTVAVTSTRPESSMNALSTSLKWASGTAANS